MKSQNKILRKRRAVSPVIATVIIVAVTITVAVAVSYWMSGIASQYTSFEKVEVQTAICRYIEADLVGPPIVLDSYWEIVVQLKNSGTKAASLTNVFINDGETDYLLTTGVPGSAGTISAVLDPITTPAGSPFYIESGVTGEITIFIVTGTTVKLTAGTTINIKIHSASGMDYIRLVQLT